MTSTAPEKLTLWYIHDPMCSWCWAFRPAWGQLRASLPETIAVRRLVGGLAPDSDEAMPAAMQAYLQQTWHRIERQVPGTRFNFDFWRRCRPRRSTYPACRAALTARELAPQSEEDMIAAIQQAYYLDARNPSDTDTLIALATEIGLDSDAFADLLTGDLIQARLLADLAQARALGADSFPSLVLSRPAGTLPIPVDYGSPDTMLAAIDRAHGDDA